MAMSESEEPALVRAPFGARPGELRKALDDALRTHSERVAVGDLTGSLTYAELDVAASAAAGTVTGRRIAIRARNSPAYVVALLGVLRAGAVPFLVDPAWSDREFGLVATACGIDAVLHDSEEGLVPAVLPVSEAPELLPDTEICRFSSGSTRTPGCIEFRGTAVLAAARGWTAASGLTAGDRILSFAGLYNGLAFNTSLIPGLLTGASLWLPRGLPSAGNVARHVEALRPHVLVGFPALYDGLARREVGTGALAEVRVALSSAAKLSESTTRTVSERYGLKIADYYGIAETGPLTFNAEPDPGTGQGRPLPGVDIRLDGTELLVRSGSAGSRYLNYPGEFERRVTGDGYYRTGDEGQLRDGRLTLLGRAGKGINIGGRKVSPDEVAEVLLTHPAVSDCHVLAGRKPNSDPVLVAVVVAANGTGAVELRQHCLARLASHKVPEKVLFVGELPRTGAGKPRTAELTVLVEEALTR